MPLNRENQRHFHRQLYAGMLESVRILKRGDDQQQGTVTAFVVHEARRGQIVKTGETIQGDMTSNHRVTWHLPKSELDRVGINFLSPLDRIEQIEGEEAGRFWQPEATTDIEIKLLGVHICVFCLRVDPPRPAA